jgi:hypothetical protein
MPAEIVRLMGLWVVLTLGTTSLSAEGKSIPRERLMSSSITWLGNDHPTNEVVEFKVMSLSCRKCLDELADILSGVAKGPSHLILNTTDPTNQDIAWIWLAAVRAQQGESMQREVALELLSIYVDSPAVYLNDPELWKQLCLARWADRRESMEEAKIWAESLNRLQQQNRLLGLLARNLTPDVIQLVGASIPLPNSPALDPEEMRMQIWENSEPALRPGWDAVAVDTRETRPVLHRIKLDPGLALSAASWRRIQGRLKDGGLFEWQSSPAMHDPTFKKWLAGLFSQPTLVLRRAWFDQAVVASIELAREKGKRVALNQAIAASSKAIFDDLENRKFTEAADFEIWATGLRD